MKEIVILSTKGSQQRDQFLADLGRMLKDRAVLAECSIAGNAFLDGLELEPKGESLLSQSQVAFIEQDACIHCGKCQRVCRFDAIENDFGTFTVDRDLCTGCGYCVKICPTTTIRQRPQKVGHIHYSETAEKLPLVHVTPSGHSPLLSKLPGEVREKARQWASDRERDLLVLHAELAAEMAAGELVVNADLVLLLMHKGKNLLSELQILGHFLNNFGKKTACLILNPGDQKKDDMTIKESIEGIEWDCYNLNEDQINMGSADSIWVKLEELMTVKAF